MAEDSPIVHIAILSALVSGVVYNYTNTDFLGYSTRAIIILAELTAFVLYLVLNVIPRKQEEWVVEQHSQMMVEPVQTATRPRGVLNNASIPPPPPAPQTTNIFQDKGELQDKYDQERVKIFNSFKRVE